MQNAVRPVLIVSALILAFVVLAHAGLIGAGQWESDEYSIIFYNAKDSYLHFMASRIHWSPRPFPETLFYIYCLLTQWFHAPLIMPFLLCCWLMLIGAAFYGACYNGSPREKGVLPWRIYLALSLLSMFLLGHSVGELFYWPAAAEPYLMALSAITFVFFLVSAEQETGETQSLLRSAALTVAALSCEMGAMFVAVFSVLQLLSRESRVCLLRRGQGKKWLYWSVPFVAALGIFALVISGRVGAGEIAFSGNLRHNVAASLGAGVVQLANDILDPGGFFELSGGAFAPEVIRNNLLFIGQGLIVRLLSFIGFALCWRFGYPSCRPVRALPLFAVALLAACYGSMASADYQFGGLCCERHETLRQCFLALVIAALAAWYSPCMNLSQRPVMQEAFAPLVLLFPVAIMLLARVPDLAWDYAHYRRSVEAREKTWKSGLSQGQRGMFLYLAPSGKVVNGTPYMLPGYYALDADTPKAIAPVLLFFEKKEMTIIAQ